MTSISELNTAADLKGIEITNDNPDYELEVKSFRLKKQFVEDKM